MLFSCEKAGARGLWCGASVWGLSQAHRCNHAAARAVSYTNVNFGLADNFKAPLHPQTAPTDPWDPRFSSKPPQKRFGASPGDSRWLRGCSGRRLRPPPCRHRTLHHALHHKYPHHLPVESKIPVSGFWKHQREAFPRQK